MPRKKLLPAALALLLFLPTFWLPAFSRKHSKPQPAAPAIPRMDERERAIHALNRLTFGPRPGDVERVLAMGVDKWIAEQLSPAQIDDRALEARLAPYRTLRMTAAEMVEDFPPPQVLKAVSEGKLAMPRDPQLKAVYTAGLARLNDRQQAKKNAQAAQNADLLETSPEDMTPEMRDRRQSAREHARSRALDLMELPPGVRTQNLAAMDADERRGFWRALSQDDREKLTADMTPQQKELLLSLENPVAVVNGELIESKLLRAAYSERQLQEVITDFWFNHFNVFIGKGADRYMVTAYERDVIRPHALGKFRDLLLATAKSPAMLWYLDNWQSVGPNSAAARGRANGKPALGLNENYAREVMELHTLGVNGGYTQKDVTELARVLTGWTLAEPRLGGGFVFREPRHEPGDKTVLGHTFHENGEREGDAALEMLARQPATARFISTKLAQRFVSDTPPPALVDAMTKTFLASDGDISAVLRTMLGAPEFWDKNEYRAKVKTPLEFAVSAIRATGADVERTQSIAAALNRMGMPLYGAQPPTGYSMLAESWINSGALLSRMNFALTLGTGKLAGVRMDAAALAGASTSPEELLRALEHALLAGGVSEQTHQTIARQMSDSSLTQRKLDDPPRPVNQGVVAGLIMGSPEFQRR